MISDQGEDALPKAPAPDPRVQAVTMPWGRDEEVAANCAIGHLRDNLQIMLTDNGRIHAETLLAVIGSIAGFAAQHAIWETMIKPGRAKLKKDIDVVMGKDGLTYYGGDIIFRHLLPQDHTLHLWSLVAAPALSLGTPSEKLPETGEIFRYVLSTIGGPEFGIIRPRGNHRPSATVRQALTVFWAPATKLFSWVGAPMGVKSDAAPSAWSSLTGGLKRLVGSETEARVHEKSLKPVHWSTVAAVVAQQYIFLTKDVLDPAIGAGIVLEAALAGALVDPATVPTKTRFRFGKDN